MTQPFSRRPARPEPLLERIPLSERFLIDLLPETPVESALTVSLGRGQVASELSQRFPEARVGCHFLDLYRADRAREWLVSRGSPVTVYCTSDFPPEEVQLVAIPCSAHGDGELTRDLLQSGFLRLAMGGQMIVATDNRRDTWLQEQLERLFRKVVRHGQRKGVVYTAIKTEPLKKVKDYSCEFAFRDCGQLVRAFSRPGVFSHRKLDVGSRALIESMEIESGQRILDLGCGSGVVSLAALSRNREVAITAVDANPRALECTRRGAELNGFPPPRTLLNADADSGEPGTFDLVLTNPPYYSNFRIGEILVQGAEQALKPGGILQLVTKQPEPYLALVDAGFENPTVTPVRQYQVVRATRRGS